MAELIGFILTMGIYFWLCSLGNKPKNNQKFGDGKSRYDFQDYVDNKADKYNK
ncbi:hypothetical protein [Clostridium sp. AF34-13]|uniref:hypothetical protein n=1 Tax=Clostridium sp. AF34-13 TaxID=2293012 RepID=UPI0015FB6892|nr:hypothetical protein [Clostridium sp. AF34-13]